MYLVVWTDNNILYSVYVRDDNLEEEQALAPYINQIRALPLYGKDLIGERYLVFRFQERPWQ